MKKKMMKAALVFMSMIFLVMNRPVIVKAQEVLAATQLSQFMTALQPIDAKEEPDENAATAFSYDSGATIFITGETKNGWYIVSYQGKTGYINKNLQEMLQVVEIDVAALDKEMQAQEDESRLIIEETERYRAESRRSKIWGAVIVLLVIGIFATGIISTVQAEKKKNEGENSEEEKAGNSIFAKFMDGLKKKDKVVKPKQAPPVEEEDDDILDLDKE